VVRSKSQTVDYFSASTFNKSATHVSQKPNWEPAFLYGINGNLAFAHNVEEGIPEFMDDVDVIYAELPWEDGYNLFYEAAGATPKQTYWEFLDKIQEQVREFGKPTLIPCGKKALKYLKPDSYTMVLLNRKEVCLALWNIEDSWGRINVVDILHDLATRFNRVGDFACGYGRTGRIFAEHGKQWVLSDINPYCIGFIKDHALEWIKK